MNIFEVDGLNLSKTELSILLRSEFVIIYSKQLSSWKPNRVYRAKIRDDRYNNVIINFEEDYSNWKFSPLLDIISEKLNGENTVTT